MAFHAHVEGAQSARQEERLQRCERSSDELLHLCERMHELVRARRDSAGQDVRVTSDVFGGGVDGNIDAGGLEAALREGRDRGEQVELWLVLLLVQGGNRSDMTPSKLIAHLAPHL